MYLKNINLIALIIILSALQVQAQRATNSPYSRYGLGDLSSISNGHNIAMGGTSLAESTPYFVNTENPAAITSFMMQRFVFDVGFDVRYTDVTSQQASQKNSNSTFNYLAGGFAVKPWWFFSFMLKPYTSVGYSYSDSTIVEYDGDKLGYKNVYEGTGGLNKLSISTAFKFLRQFSVGATGSVIFGNIERTHNITMSRYIGTVDSKPTYQYQASYYTNKFIMHGLQGDIGLRYEKRWRSRKDTLREAVRLSIGAFMGCEAKIKARDELNLFTYTSKTNSSGYSYSSQSDTIMNDTLYNGKITLPKKLGLGVSVEFMEKLMVNADISKQAWSSFQFPGHESSNNVRDSKYMGVGLQYVHAKYSSRFFKTINYRLGLHKQDTYLKFGEYGIEDKGFSFGLGLPIRTLIFNVSCDIGKRGTTEHNLYEEKYFLMNFSISAHDVWFVKRKFQ